MVSPRAAPTALRGSCRWSVPKAGSTSNGAPLGTTPLILDAESSMSSPLRLLKSPANDVIASYERVGEPPRVIAISVVGTHEADIGAAAVMPRLQDLAVHMDALGRAGGRLLVIDVKNARRSREVIGPMLETDADGVLVACRTREAFFAALSELGLDREAVVSLAQSYPLLRQQDTPTREGVTGNAHKLLEHISRGELYYWSGLTPEDKAQASNAYPSMSEDITRAVKIDLGADPGECPVEEEASACRMPYPLCLFEYPIPAQRPDGTSTQIRVMALVKQEGDMIHSVFFRTHPPGERFFFLCLGASWFLDGSRLAWSPVLYTQEPPPELGPDWHDHVASFLGPLIRGMAAINRPGTRVSRIAASPKLQKARATRRQHPIFDYHVCELAPAATTDDVDTCEQGSAVERASPRLHQRRGHYRMRASGKRIWVSAATVGTPISGALGIELSHVPQRL